MMEKDILAEIDDVLVDYAEMTALDFSIMNVIKRETDIGCMQMDNIASAFKCNGNELMNVIHSMS